MPEEKGTLLNACQAAIAPAVRIIRVSYSWRCEQYDCHVPNVGANLAVNFQFTLNPNHILRSVVNEFSIFCAPTSYFCACCGEEQQNMDVSDRVQARQSTVKDVTGERVQRLFQDFLEE